MDKAELEVTWDSDCQVESGVCQSRFPKIGVGQGYTFGIKSKAVSTTEIIQDMQIKGVKK